MRNKKKLKKSKSSETPEVLRWSIILLFASFPTPALTDGLLMVSKQQ